MNKESNIKLDYGMINIPGSKSLTQRALVAAALARDNSFISNALVAEDTLHLMDGLRTLGAQIVAADGGFFYFWNCRQTSQQREGNISGK